jgi:cysteine desulfurase
MYASKGNHIITCTIEHKAVIDTCKHIEKMGGEVTYLEPGPDGMINLAELEAAIKPTTILISIMYANNEIGTVNPMAEISKIARKHGVLVMSDATQAVGKIPVDVNKDGIDIMAFTGHKMYGPKGVGALYVRRKNPRVKVTAQMDGGGHERGMRSGTLNVPGIVGFGKACEICMQDMEKDMAHTRALRDRLEAGLLQIEESYLNGHKENRYIVQTTLQLGEHCYTIELSLSNRDAFRFRLLLGREALNKRMVVDPSLVHQQRKKKTL